MRIQLLLLLFFGAEAFGQGSFRYVSHHQGRLSGGNPAQFDFNDDGAVDLSIRYGYVVFGPMSGAASFAGQLQNGSKALAHSDHCCRATMLTPGDSINSDSIPDRMDWFQNETELGPVSWVDSSISASLPLGGVSAVSDRISYFGIAEPDGAIIGIRILGEDGYHNGWVRFETVATESGGKFVRTADWAYNLNPEQAILAGMLQVPEPRTRMMIVLGLVVCAGARKRVRR